MRDGEDPRRKRRACLGAPVPARARELYDRLVSAERLHPDLVAWLPEGVERIVEVGAGAGRLTLELLDRAERVCGDRARRAVARAVARRSCREPPRGDRARVLDGFFDELPLADEFADLVVDVLGVHSRRRARRRSGTGGDGARLPPGRSRRDRVAQQPRLARRARLPPPELRRRDVRRVREPPRRLSS